MPGPEPVLRMMADDRASAALGIELVTAGEGSAHTRLTVRDDMVNGHDIAHGAVVFALADTAFACACNSWGPVTVAAGAQIEFLRPARRGDVLDAHATVRRRWGRQGVYDVTVVRGEDVVAEFRGRSTQLRSPAAGDAS